VREVADKITVIRLGKVVGQAKPTDTNAQMASMMVGRAVELMIEKSPAEPGDEALVVTDLSVIDARSQYVVSHVSFEVRRGEILAIAGVDGNGQSELVEAVTGLRRVESGEVLVAGRTFTHASTRELLDAGLGHIPEDRLRRGLVLEYSIAENIALHDYAKPPDARYGWLFPRRMIGRARRLIEDFDVRGGGPLTRAGGLSGGNQQKLVAAREIDRDPKVLIAAQPTRGLDVGAIEYLHRRLVAERDEGRAILLISLELEEIMSLSDRILVVYEGQIVAEHTGEVSEEEIGLEMLGGKEAAAA
jgi:simple sugar transport system ATP-binding protein